MNPQELLRNAADLIEERGKERDREGGERSMAAAVGAFNCLSGHSLTEADGWRFMAALKLARSFGGGYKRDDYEDLAAYAALTAESLEVSPTANQVRGCFNCKRGGEDNHCGAPNSIYMNCGPSHGFKHWLCCKGAE